MKTIVVIDGKGGGVGSALISRLKAENVPARVLALGTNGATGENAIVRCCQRADVVAGPIGIVLAGAMLGEVTDAMAAAAAQCESRVLIPNAKSGTYVCGVQELTLTQYIELAARQVARLVQGAGSPLA